MNCLTLSAYAKINLHLEITGKREDGYHTVESLMQSISLCDILTFRKIDSGIRLTCSDPSLAVDVSNLAYRAASAFFAESEQDGGIAIHLDKRIPMQAGLGGGSSDAAAVLRGMNLLAAHPLPEQTLMRIAAGLGADVPFCLRVRSALALGIGTELHDAPSLPPCHILIGIGKGDKMSTREAYSALDALAFAPHSYDELKGALHTGDFEGLCHHLFNRFSILNPSAEQGCQRLRSLGAAGTLLCGSGAAFFGLFAPHAKDEAKSAKEILAQEGYRTWLAEPL